ncbi:M16 family metallopeptidase [Siccibacter colletis]|uniref:Insulinase family protein n=1 Tax=Siccibacter colletis TaxID=1505757 RepID=A0ABY6JJB4_9ENTR|nr:M16 family metallopeptidase [Siccibacter colletis]UYU32526.1 insulinase family protein [Siccibacter colletis]
MMWLTPFRGVCAALLATSLSLSAHAADASSPLPEIHEGELTNGLRYTLVPIKADKGRVDIRLSVNAGSLDETPDQSGVAHMVEHMVFRASRSWPDGVADALARQGWQRGLHYNAMTNYQRTLYMFSPPNGVKGLPLALEALNQMTRHAQLTQRDLDDERKVILEEWRGKLGVAERMNQQRVAAIRDGSRYPDRPVIGTEASIRTTPASTLQAFYQQCYRPAAMRLMIIGDIDIKSAEAQIARQFASEPALAAAVRADDNPILKPQRRIVRLQDSESGSSQVSLVMRFREAWGAGPAGFRDRLINQIVTSVLSDQLLRQRDGLPAQVGNIVARRSDIASETVAFALFADVNPGSHLDGLKVVFQERDRLKRYGLRHEDIDAERQRLLKVAQRMKTKPEMRTFSDWVQILNASWSNGNAYYDTQARGAAAADLLATITPEEVNARLSAWLNAPDTLVQFSFPGKTHWTLPAAKTVDALEAAVATAPLAKPLAPQPVSVPTLPTLDATGSRTGVKDFPQAEVMEWQLSNGDRVVWLKTPLAEKKVWFTARSEAGYMGDGMVPWQAQLASQLVDQSGPAGWHSEALQQWKKQNGVSLSVDQQAQTLTVSGQVSLDKLDALFHLYQALQTRPGIDGETMKSSLMQLARRLAVQQGSSSARREDEITRLRFGKPAFAQPTPAQLNTLAPETLLNQWRTATRAPVTYFVLADMPADTLEAAVTRWLSAIPRGDALHAAPYLARPGLHEQTSAVNIEPKADVRLWSFTDAGWTPARAVQVSIARNLMNQHLKGVLRDDARGIYNMRFTSELNDNTGRIETEVRFTTSPARAREMARRATQAFQGLKIDKRTVDAQRAQFIKAEKNRAQDIYTLQRRLLLSYAHFDNPSYLTQLDTLADAITVATIRDAAAHLLSAQNQALYIALPQEAVK